MTRSCCIKPRVQRAVDMQPGRPAVPAAQPRIGERVPGTHRDSPQRRPSSAQPSASRAGSSTAMARPKPSSPSKAVAMPASSRGERDEYFAMPRRHLGRTGHAGFAGCKAFSNRRQPPACQHADSALERGSSSSPSSRRPRLGPMQRRHLALRSSFVRVRAAGSGRSPLCPARPVPPACGRVARAQRQFQRSSARLERARHVPPSPLQHPDVFTSPARPGPVSRTARDCFRAGRAKCPRGFRSALRPPVNVR